MSNHDGKKISHEPVSLGVMICLILLCVFCILLTMGFIKACHASESDRWSRADTIREGVFHLTNLADCLTTIDIAANPDRYRETNPVLGTHPNRESVYLWFGLSSLAHLGISYVLPRRFREPFQYVTIMYEAGYTAHNFGMGLRFRF